MAFTSVAGAMIMTSALDPVLFDKSPLWGIVLSPAGGLLAGRPTLGTNLLMDVVGATVIGGTSLMGGKGKAIWTVFGVLFFVLLGNTLNLLSLSFFTVTIVKGAVILFAALLDVTRVRLLARQ